MITSRKADWHLDAEGRTVLSADGHVIAVCFGQRDKTAAAIDEARSNARLIAMLPRLLDALNRISDGRGHRESDLSLAMREVARDVLQEARNEEDTEAKAA